MRQSKIMARLRAGKAARIAMLGHFVPAFIAYAAEAGFDGVWLDCEHRAWDDREIQAMLAFFHLYDIDCMLRPATREKAKLYRYLEDGATGFVVPHVSTPEEAQALVKRVKFPPVGDRGINSVALEANFGVDISGDRAKLAIHALRETFLMVQIETPEGLNNVEAIAGVPGLDGLYIGPSDLMLRLNQAPDDQRVRFDAAQRRVAEAAASQGIHWGSFPGSVDVVREQAALGARLLVWGIETSILRKSLNQAGEDLNAVWAELDGD